MSPTQDIQVMTWSKGCMGLWEDAVRWHRIYTSSKRYAKPRECPFASKIELMEGYNRTFEPVAGTVTHVLLDSWYSAKCHGLAARECEFLITMRLKSNRWLRVTDPTAPQGSFWQQLSDYTTHLSASNYRQLEWPKGDDDVSMHVVTTQVHKLYQC